MLLAIDTSTRYAGVCLRDEQWVVASVSWRSAHNHTRELMPAIQQLLRQRGSEVGALRAIAVALGPGGFSALRVGMSVAKGLAFSLDVPLVGVETLEMEAYPYATTGVPTSPLLDVGRGEVAAAVFGQVDGVWRKVVEAAIRTPEDLVETIKGHGYERVLFCGEGVQGREAFLKEALRDEALVVTPHVAAVRLWALAQLGWQRYTSGQFDDVAALQPFYLRRPSIGTPRAPRPVKS